MWRIGVHPVLGTRVDRDDGDLRRTVVGAVFRIIETREFHFYLPYAGGHGRFQVRGTVGWHARRIVRVPDTASRLFAQLAYAAVQMNDIARVAGEGVPKTKPVTRPIVCDFAEWRMLWPACEMAEQDRRGPRV